MSLTKAGQGRRVTRRRWHLFHRHYEPTEGCWEWVGCKYHHGYGQYGREYAHRVMWEWKHGEPPAMGLLVLHSCDNPSCVNPDHLYLGDQKKNMSDCAARGRIHYARKTHCPKGHPYSGDNLSIRGGRRHCRTCGRLRQRVYRMRKCPASS